jgi:hypothetical protein
MGEVGRRTEETKGAKKRKLKINGKGKDEGRGGGGREGDGGKVRKMGKLRKDEGMGRRRERWGRRRK